MYVFMYVCMYIHTSGVDSELVKRWCKKHECATHKMFSSLIIHVGCDQIIRIHMETR